MTSHGRRKQVRHYEAVQQLHELTFSCYHQHSLLADSGRCRILAHAIDAACREQNFRLVAFVFMPDHVHLLVWPESLNSQVCRLLARIKQPATRRIRSMLESTDSALLRRLLVRQASGKTCLRFWQQGPGFDRNLFSAEAIEASIDYIHNNPVRRGLCLRPTEYKWSSARFYIDHTSDDDLPTLTRPDNRWLDNTGHQTEHS